MIIRKRLLLCAAVLALSACGGGGGDLIEVPTVPVPNNRVLAPGSYKLSFSAISTARLSSPISGVDVAVRFPVGLSVRTLTGGTGQIASTSLTSGISIRSTTLAYGNYSASTRTAYINLATTEDNYRGGQYLNLYFTVAAGTSVTPDTIYALNASFPTYQVIGINAVTHSTVYLTDSVKTTLGVEQ